MLVITAHIRSSDIALLLDVAPQTPRQIVGKR